MSSHWQGALTARNSCLALDMTDPFSTQLSSDYAGGFFYHPVYIVQIRNIFKNMIPWCLPITEPLRVESLYSAHKMSVMRKFNVVHVDLNNWINRRIDKWFDLKDTTISHKVEYMEQTGMISLYLMIHLLCSGFFFRISIEFGTFQISRHY